MIDEEVDETQKWVIKCHQNCHLSRKANFALPHPPQSPVLVLKFWCHHGVLRFEMVFYPQKTFRGFKYRNGGCSTWCWSSFLAPSCSPTVTSPAFASMPALLSSWQYFAEKIWWSDNNRWLSTHHSLANCSVALLDKLAATNESHKAALRSEVWDFELQYHYKRKHEH